MKKALLIALAFLFPMAASFAWAGQESRFALSETDAGTIRLDKQTGEVSFCRPANGSLACTIAADERRAWINNTQELGRRVDRLETRIRKLEANTAAPTTSNRPRNPLTDEEEKKLDNAMRVGEEFLKRFMGIVKDLQDTYEDN